MADEVYRGLTAKDIDSLVIDTVVNFDLFGWHGATEETIKSIDRLNKARTEILKERENKDAGI